MSHATVKGSVQLAYSIPVPIGPSGSADVEIRVSTRRKKSAQAHLESGRVVVVVPSGLSALQRENLARRLAVRMIGDGSGRRVRSDRELERRCTELSEKYLGGVRPTSIRWVTNQARRWGSCTPATGAIRLSSRLQGFPAFVIDAVIVHELAHLLEASHSSRFRELCGTYPRQAEADAFLLGFERGAATASMPLGPVPEVSWAAGDDVVADPEGALAGSPSRGDRRSPDNGEATPRRSDGDGVARPRRGQVARK